MTRDIDTWGRVVDGELHSATPLPETLVSAVETIGRVRSVSPAWLNAQVAAELFGRPWPDGIVERATPIELDGLTLLVVARADLVRLKLAAAIQPGVFAPRAVDEKHRSDLRAMRPSTAELDDAVAWIRAAFGDLRADAARERVEEDH